MSKLERDIEQLLKFGWQAGWIGPLDIIYTRNQLYDLFQIEEPDLKGVHLTEAFQTEASQAEVSHAEASHAEVSLTGRMRGVLPSPAPILARLLDAAYERGLMRTNTITERDLMDARIMGLLLPRPSEVSRRFWELAESKGVQQATDWFYRLSQMSNYIRMDRIAKNEYWTVETEYGKLELTINLSKPELDPKEIAALKEAPKRSYPSCLLCLENVGYAGRLDHPARQNHRVVPVKLDGETWYLQYSPYVYYNEHCILLSEEHRPMRIDRSTFERLLSFIEQFPHYFIGSNADLPIVGGSILSHDHYQGGRHRFAMEVAPDEKTYIHPDFPGVSVAYIKWPLTVLRIRTSDKRKAVNMAEHIRRCWQKYSDLQADLQHESNANGQIIPHNTVTPIARFNAQGEYELDIVLRNNRTSEKHPEGIFHPHRELHHIKKENIGLIEVMGLAVLPGRLQQELEQIANWLLKKRTDIHHPLPELNDPLYPHAEWMKELAETYIGKKGAKDVTTRAEVMKLLRQEVGFKFTNVLEHCGVFKRTSEGMDALERFMAVLGMKKIRDHQK